MREYVMHAMYPDIIIKHVPAMPVTQIHDEPQPHRERGQSQEGSEDFEGAGQTGPCSSRFSQEALADFSGFHGQGQDLFQLVSDTKLQN